MNYRSAPELVRIQRHLIRHLDPHSPLPKAFDDGSDGNGECRVLVYPSHQREAQHLADLLHTSIQEQHLCPRDICILTRNRPDRYGHYLCAELTRRGIKARVENELQDLLAEPLVLTLLDLLKVAMSLRSPQAWSNTSSMLLDLCGVRDSDQDACKVERLLATSLKRLRPIIRDCKPDKAAIMAILRDAMDIVGESAFRERFQQYKQGDWYHTTLDRLARELELRTASDPDWLVAIEDLEGATSIPIMTVHKSKGLEYHTVVFIGLEDSALFGFADSPDEEKCGFFVALSRAKKRAIFTFCRCRPRTPGAAPEDQTRQKIGVLYDLLEQAGVTPEIVH